jgi:TonB family protein
MKKLGLLLLLGTSALTANIAIAEDIVPVLDVAPEYPVVALRRDISGHVVVRFDVDEDGKAQNISIVEASPERIFNGAVRVALKRSTFTTSDSISSTSFERTYHFNQSADNDLANRFNFMEGAPQLATN